MTLRACLLGHVHQTKFNENDTGDGYGIDIDGNRLMMNGLSVKRIGDFLNDEKSVYQAYTQENNDAVGITTTRTACTMIATTAEVKGAQSESDKAIRLGVSLEMPSRSREASMTPLAGGGTNSIDARIEFLENNDIVFGSIFENASKYFNKKETKTAQRELSDIWVVLKDGINDNTLNSLLMKLVFILFVNEENLVKLSFVESSNDVEGIAQIKHNLDSSLFSQMVLKIGCFIWIFTMLVMAKQQMIKRQNQMMMLIIRRTPAM